MEAHLIDIARLVALSAACVALAACGGGDSVQAQGESAAPSPPPAAPAPARTSPDGAPHQAQQIFYPTVPSARFDEVVAWGQATTSTSTATGVASSVQIDFMKLIEVTASGEVSPPATERTFNQNLLGCVYPLCEGAGYSRSPWYDHQVTSTLAGATISGGALNIELGSRPDQIAHWWTARADVTPTSRYIVRARFLVNGEAWLQFGVDYWMKDRKGNGWEATCTTSENCEAWVGDWVGDTNGQWVERDFPAFPR